MIVALDLETTGLDRKNDAIIEVALIKIDKKTFKVLDTYNTFINPWIEIPDLVSNITNISQDDVDDAPIFSYVSQEIRDFIWDYPILWHNTNFDRDFLINHGISIEKNLVLDTFFLANFLLYNSKSLNLGFICNQLWIKIKWEHRAIYDTEATIEVYKKLIGMLKKLPKQKKEIFRYITDRTKEKQWIFYREKYLKNINKVDSQKIIKSILSTIKKNQSYQKLEQSYDLEEKNIEEIFKNLKNFEIRENQIKMAKIVYDTLTHGKKSLIEAPTWVGKTFAYLIPSILFSTKLGEQVFISTSTKALQDQIFFKDLDFLSKNIGIDFSFTKLKWKNNYIWIYAFFSFLDLEEQYTTNMSCFFLKILFWLLNTKSGELDELDFYGEEYNFLYEINANDFYTFSSENIYESYEFVVRARRQARKSNIVIINNNILFQDIEGNGNILGKVKNLIIDEAHNLEDVITQSAKKTFTKLSVEKFFIELEKKVKKSWEDATKIWYKREKILFDITTLMEFFYSYILEKVPWDSRYKNILLQPDFFQKNELSEDLSIKIQKDIGELLTDIQEFSDNTKLFLGREILFFEEVKEILFFIFSSKKTKENIIPMVSHSDKYGVSVEYTLLKPWDFLKKSLWKTLDTAILTSATLQVGKSFSYIENMLSLKNFATYELETDFNYEKQSLLFIPNNLGSIKNNLSEILDFLRKFFPLIWWRSLVLFTSFFMIQEAYLALNNTLKKEDIHLLAQSISWGKQKQIDFFKKNAKNSILMGTDTFWEWIDIAWDDLKYLIIHKIPFMVPTDPIFQARSSLFKDSFKEYAIPKSILKLKQGFGRLIRTKTDSWIVIFLDNRILTTSWWNMFYDAFPKEIKTRISSTESLLSIIKK